MRLCVPCSNFNVKSLFQYNNLVCVCFFGSRLPKKNWFSDMFLLFLWLYANCSFTKMVATQISSLCRVFFIIAGTFLFPFHFSATVAAANNSLLMCLAKSQRIYLWTNKFMQLTSLFVHTIPCSIYDMATLYATA